jgi:hypothetical protein
MEPGNQALNLLQQIISIAERQTITIANYLNYIREVNPNPTPKVARIIEGEEEKLTQHILYLEELQNKFIELMQHLESMQQDYIDMTKATNVIFYKLKDLELINKDALYWKKKAEYYDSTRKLIFNEYMKLKNGQENNQHRGC